MHKKKLREEKSVLKVSSRGSNSTSPLKADSKSDKAKHRSRRSISPFYSQPAAAISDPLLPPEPVKRMHSYSNADERQRPSAVIKDLDKHKDAPHAPTSSSFKKWAILSQDHVPISERSPVTRSKSVHTSPFAVPISIIKSNPDLHSMLKATVSPTTTDPTRALSVSAAVKQEDKTRRTHKRTPSSATAALLVLKLQDPAGHLGTQRPTGSMIARGNLRRTKVLASKEESIGSDLTSELSGEGFWARIGSALKPLEIKHQEELARLEQAQGDFAMPPPAAFTPDMDTAALTADASRVEILAAWANTRAALPTAPLCFDLPVRLARTLADKLRDVADAVHAGSPLPHPGVDPVLLANLRTSFLQSPEFKSLSAAAEAALSELFRGLCSSAHVGVFVEAVQQWDVCVVRFAASADGLRRNLDARQDLERKQLAATQAAELQYLEEVISKAKVRVRESFVSKQKKELKAFKRMIVKVRKEYKKGVLEGMQDKSWQTVQDIHEKAFRTQQAQVATGLTDTLAAKEAEALQEMATIQGASAEQLRLKHAQEVAALKKQTDDDLVGLSSFVAAHGRQLRRVTFQDLDTAVSDLLANVRELMEGFFAFVHEQLFQFIKDLEKLAASFPYASAEITTFKTDIQGAAEQAQEGWRQYRTHLDPANNPLCKKLRTALLKIEQAKTLPDLQAIVPPPAVGLFPDPQPLPAPT